jgi:hypothetical protein
MARARGAPAGSGGSSGTYERGGSADWGHPCRCGCHGGMVVHKDDCCSCGRPVCPPSGPPKPKPCPPREAPPQPGTTDLPHPDPPTFPTGPVPPWGEGRPPTGDPGQLPWFQGKVNDLRFKGPRFGPRKDEYLPYLFMRAASGDRGARPFSGVFWESPDIFVAAQQDAASAPLFPPSGAGVATASAPNTLYAHVWNLGKAPAYRVRVEFYWFNPTLGINRADAHLIGAAWIDLANRFTVYPDWQERTGPDGNTYVTRGAHAIVRCPQTWVASFENGGHECLVVRAYEPMMDSVPLDQFTTTLDRHVAQRNIAVVQSSSPAAIDLPVDLGSPEVPADAEVDVRLDPPAAMEWLKVYTGRSEPGLRPPAEPVVAGFLPPSVPGARRLSLDDLPYEARASMLRAREAYERGCCPLRVHFHASIRDLRPDEAQVLRLRQRVNGEVVGGYTVVLLGRRP